MIKKEGKRKGESECESEFFSRKMPQRKLVSDDVGFSDIPPRKKNMSW